MFLYLHIINTGNLFSWCTFSLKLKYRHCTYVQIHVCAHCAKKFVFLSTHTHLCFVFIMVQSCTCTYVLLLRVIVFLTMKPISVHVQKWHVAVLSALLYCTPGQNMDNALTHYIYCPMLLLLLCHSTPSLLSTLPLLLARNRRQLHI